MSDPPVTPKRKLYPPPADAKEWTCPMCGMDCLFCGCPEPPSPRLTAEQLRKQAAEWRRWVKEGLSYVPTMHLHEAETYERLAEAEEKSASLEARLATLQAERDEAVKLRTQWAIDADTLQAERDALKAGLIVLRDCDDDCWCGTRRYAAEVLTEASTDDNIVLRFVAECEDLRAQLARVKADRAAERERTERAEAAIRGLLKQLPVLWGDHVIGGQLTLCVDEGDVDYANDLLRADLAALRGQTPDK